MKKIPLFVHINKTGGTSVRRALGLMHGKKHFTALELKAQAGEKWRDGFKFTVVRNPWAKVVSMYHYRESLGMFANEDMNFKKWVREAYGNRNPDYYDWEKMFMPQMNWITNKNGRIIVDFIGRTETLDKDFNHICKQLGVEAVLGHENGSRHEHYSRYYDDETREIIADLFGCDIKGFGYEYKSK